MAIDTVTLHIGVLITLKWHNAKERTF